MRGIHQYNLPDFCVRIAMDHELVIVPPLDSEEQCFTLRHFEDRSVGIMGGILAAWDRDGLDDCGIEEYVKEIPNLVAPEDVEMAVFEFREMINQMNAWAKRYFQQ